MSWAAVFTLINVVAVIGWLFLLLGSRGPRTTAVVFYAGVGLLCLIYVILIIGLHGHAFDAQRVAGAPPPNALDYNIAGLRNLFMSDRGVVLGWTHYLAFDLFVGQWIAKDADHKGVSRLIQAPVLILTFLLGPLGLLVWLVLRERRARSQARVWARD